MEKLPELMQLQLQQHREETQAQKYEKVVKGSR